MKTFEITHIIKVDDKIAEDIFWEAGKEIDTKIIESDFEYAYPELPSYCHKCIMTVREI